MIQEERDIDKCSCGLSQCLTNCPKYSGMSPFNPDEVGLLELFDKVDEQIAVYKKMPAGRERNAFRHHVSNLVAITNKRGLQTNKIAPFKNLWWL